MRARTTNSGLASSLICSLSILLSVGCRQEAARDAVPARLDPKAGGTLRLLHEAPATLDPALVDDVYEGTVVNQLYEGLVALNQNLSPIPGLAESWVISDDGRTYTFHLRAGVRFHDGATLSAHDVVASLTRTLDPRKPAPCLAETYLTDIVGARDYVAGKSSGVRGLTAVGDSEVRVELEQPLAFFLSVLSMDQTRIIRQGVQWGELDTRPVGTGAFRFSRRERDGGVVLARNEQYWGAHAYLDTLKFVAESPTTSEQIVALLVRHRVDGAPISHRFRDLLERSAGFRIQASPELSLTFLGINNSRPPFNRVEVRHALAHAIDPAAVSRSRGRQVELAQAILPPGMPGYHPDPDLLRFDLAEAGRMLAAAGIDAAHPSRPTVLTTSRSSLRFNWLKDSFARNLTQLGLDMRMEELDWPELDRRVTANDIDLFTMTWVADVPDPDAFLYFLFRTGEANNLFAFSDAEIDTMLARGRRLPPGPRRFDVYEKIESRVLTLLPMVPLYHETSLYAWDSRLQGMEVSPFGLAQTNFAGVWYRGDRSPEFLAVAR